MKIKITGNEVATSRDQMREIKRMDHRQMDGFLTGIYRAGKKDGAKETEAAAVAAVIKEQQKAWAAFLTTINSVKGIGEQRRKELRLKFREEFKDGE